MAILELERYRAAKLLKEPYEPDVPSCFLGKVKVSYHMQDNMVILVKTCFYDTDLMKWTVTRIAQFEYDLDSNSWTLYCYDRNSKRQPYLPMAIPELERYRAAKLLKEPYEPDVLSCFLDKVDVPSCFLGKVKVSYHMQDNMVILVKTCCYNKDPMKWNVTRIAQFEYDLDSNSWTLYCYDRNSKRRPYLPQSDKGNLETLIAEVKKDPTGIFWG